jgi:hypothetical protein
MHQRRRGPTVGRLGEPAGSWGQNRAPEPVTVYTAEPGWPTEEKLALLASWVAPADQAQPDPAAHKA